MAGSVFATIEDASSFFRTARQGYAVTPDTGVFDGVELETCGWGIQPMALDEVRSSFFEDASHFPPGTAELDSAFLMERIETVWRARPRLVADVRA